MRHRYAGWRNVKKSLSQDTGKARQHLQKRSVCDGNTNQPPKGLRRSRTAWHKSAHRCRRVACRSQQPPTQRRTIPKESAFHLSSFETSKSKSYQKQGSRSCWVRERGHGWAADGAGGPAGRQHCLLTDNKKSYCTSSPAARRAGDHRIVEWMACQQQNVDMQVASPVGTSIDQRLQRCSHRPGCSVTHMYCQFARGGGRGGEPHFVLLFSSLFFFMVPPCA